MELRHFPIQRKKIPRFAYRSNDVDFLTVVTHTRARILPYSLARPAVAAYLVARAGLDDRYDFVITLIKGWANQVVHPAIDNGEFFRRRFFDVTHTRKQNASIPYKKTTGLHQDTNAKLA